MVDHGADPGADLYKLLVVAKNDLPSVSGVHADTVTKYDHVRRDQGAAGKLKQPRVDRGEPEPGS